MTTTPQALMLCDEFGVQAFRVPLAPYNVAECVAVLTRFDLTPPVVKGCLERLVEFADGGWRCSHDGPGVSLDAVLGVGVRWCEQCRKAQAAWVVDERGYLDVVNVAAAAVTIAYLGSRTDRVADHARANARAALRGVVDDDGEFAGVAEEILGWTGSGDPRRRSVTSLEVSDLVAVGCLAATPLLDGRVSYGAAEAVGLGACLGDIATTARVGLRHSPVPVQEAVAGEIDGYVHDLIEIASATVQCTVAIEHRSGYSEIWCDTSAGAFICDSLMSEPGDVQRLLVAMPDGIATRVAATTGPRVGDRSRGSSPSSPHPSRRPKKLCVSRCDCRLDASRE